MCVCVYQCVVNFFTQLLTVMDSQVGYLSHVYVYMYVCVCVYACTNVW